MQFETSNTGGTSTKTTSKITTNTKKAGPKGPAPVQVLAEGWCEYIGVEVKDLSGYDWKTLGDHIKKGADVEQLKALSEACDWKPKKFNLRYLFNERTSLLPKIKPKNEKTFYTVADMQEINRKND